MTSDEELMSAVAGGDIDAFDELVRRHQQAALDIAYRFLGDRDEAEDLAQEAFLKILDRAGSYRPSASFRTYLYRVLVNACLDYRRKKRPVPVESLPPVADGGDDPAAALERRQKSELVRRAIDVLPARQRMALILQHYEGLSYEEIAASLRCSRSAVESLLVRAKRTLRDMLKGLL